MNLYLLSQNRHCELGYYKHIVVAAPSIAIARKYQPYNEFYSNGNIDPTWVAPEYVSVRLIGEADPNVLRGVVCQETYGLGDNGKDIDIYT